MWRGGSNDDESSQHPRQGCATFSSSSYSCTNGDCKETQEEFRKCPGLPLQRLQRNRDGTSSWVNHSGDLPFGLSGGSNLNEFMRSVMRDNWFDVIGNDDLTRNGPQKGVLPHGRIMREFLGDFGFNNRHPDRSGSPHSHNQHSVPHNKPSDTGGAYDGFKVEDA